MFKEKLVSVIMPVYNAEKHLRLAIESILNQTYRNFELIITDDGSTDGSLEIILEYSKKDDRIVVISRKNRGLVYTLNEAIDMANGEYIARMDADDMCHESRFQKQVDLLNRRPQVYMVGCDFNLEFEEGVSEELKASMTRYQEKSNSYKMDSNQGSILQGYVLLHPTWVVRRELYGYVGKYRECYKACEDGEFLFRVISKGFLVDKVSEKLFDYRITNTSKSAVDRVNKNLKRDTIKFHIEFLEKVFGDSLNHMRYLLWGASETGEMTGKYLEQKYPDSKLVAYVDSVKKGVFNGKPVISYEEIGLQSKNYILICTHGGAEFAKEFLQSMGYEEVKDYLVLI